MNLIGKAQPYRTSGGKAADGLAAYCLLPTAFCFNALSHGRATAPGLLSKRNALASNSNYPGAFAFSITHTAA